MVRPSWVSTRVSMAVSLPVELRSVEVTLVGQAFLIFQITTGSCSSFSRLMVMSRRSMVFSDTVFHHS